MTTDEIVTVTASDIAELSQLVKLADASAYGDSNDDEIAALREAMEFAASLLGVKAGFGDE